MKCLMLDVDGVVVHGRPEDGQLWAKNIERDLGIVPERLHALFFAPHWDAIVTGRKNLVSVLEEILPLLTHSITAQSFIEYWFERDSRVDEAVLMECDELRKRGVRIFLATNQEHMRAQYIMDRLSLRKRVDGMIYSAEIAARKPQRSFFEVALKRSGFAAGETILVDDTKANVIAALNAGWQAVHWSEGSSLIELLSY